jgi:hypothetical protein
VLLMEVIWSTLRHVHISDQFGNEELVRNEPELYSFFFLVGLFADAAGCCWRGRVFLH